MSMMHQDPNEWLMGSAGKHWSWKDAVPGQVRQGVIKNFYTEQQVDFATKLPKTFKDGGAMMQVVIVLDTPERDPNIEGDDGVRKDYVKGGDNQKALAQGCREGGLPKGLVIGATYARRYDGEGVADGNLNPPKLYSFRLSPPPGYNPNQQTAQQLPPAQQFAPQPQAQQFPPPAPVQPQAPTPQAVQPVGVADLFGS